MLRQRLALLVIGQQEEVAMTTDKMAAAGTLGELLRELQEIQAALADGGLVSSFNKI